MIDPSLPVQKAVIAALRGEVAVTALVAQRSWDNVPTDADGNVYPQVTLGPAQVVPDQNGCGDQYEVWQQIDWWSRKVGAVEAKQISAAVCVLFGVDLTIEGFRVVTQTIDALDPGRSQPDGLTTKGTMSLYLSLVPTP